MTYNEAKAKFKLGDYYYVEIPTLSFDARSSTKFLKIVIVDEVDTDTPFEVIVQNIKDDNHFWPENVKRLLSFSEEHIILLSLQGRIL